MTLESEAFSEEDITAFRRDGYVIVRQLFPAEHVKHLAECATWHIDLSATQVADDAPQRRFAHVPNSEVNFSYVRLAVHLCHTDPIFRAHALSSCIVSRVTQLLGGSVCVYTDLFHNKPPLVGHVVEPHQDHAYYVDMIDDPLVTCWLAIDDADPENGSIEYLPGSHARLLRHVRGEELDLAIPRTVLANACFVPTAVRSGDCIFHHSLIVHRSGANKSSTWRRGLGTMYLRADTVTSWESFGPYKPIPV